MSTVGGINCNCKVVQKDKSVAVGAFSLNGHDSLYSISAKNPVLIVPTLAQKPTNMQLTYFHYPVGQQYCSGFLVWRQYDMLLQAIISFLG